MWDGVKTLVQEIQICEKAGATSAAVAMAFICVDTMAYLSLPAGRETQTRADFISWVDSYLKGHQDQPYQYRGIDVYGARCAVLHTFGADADFHDRNPDAKKFGYHDGGKHAYDPTVNGGLVIIGTASFLSDVISAVQSFMEVCLQDRDLRERVERRLPKVMANLPLSK